MLAQVREWVVSGLKWLIWRPRRLVAAAVVLLGVVIVANVIVGAVNGSSAPTATATPKPDGLPSGWATWPTVASTPVPTAAPVTHPDSAWETDAPEATVAPDKTDAAVAQKLRSSAVTFMSAYARPAAGSDARAWWAAVVPTLTATAAKDTEGTVPDSVPWTRIVGDAVLVPPMPDAEDGMVREVDVTTDAGTWRVVVAVEEMKVQAWRRI